MRWKGRSSGRLIEDIRPNEYVLAIDSDEHNNWIEHIYLKARRAQFPHNNQICGGEDKREWVSLVVMCDFSRRPSL